MMLNFLSKNKYELKSLIKSKFLGKIAMEFGILKCTVVEMNKGDRET